MNKSSLVLALVLSVAGFSAQATEVTDSAVGTIKQANCTLVAKESTTGSTVIGGGAGAVGGAIAGHLIGGKKGSGWGALLGAAGGALIGHNSGDETYACRLLVESKYGKQVVETNAEKKLRVGDTINLIQTDDGKVTPM